MRAAAAVELLDVLFGVTTHQPTKTHLLVYTQNTTRHTLAPQVFFAFCYPYSYDDTQRRLEELDRKFPLRSPRPPAAGEGSNSGADRSGADGGPDGGGEQDDIYYHRELLVRSIDGLRVDLITVCMCAGGIHRKMQ